MQKIAEFAETGDEKTLGPPSQRVLSLGTPWSLLLGNRVTHKLRLAVMKTNGLPVTGP